MKTRTWLRNWIEYLPSYLLLKLLGLLPRRWALKMGYGLGCLLYHFWWRLRRVGLSNLELVFPELSRSDHRRILRGAYRNMGRLLGEFSQFPKFTPANILRIVEYEGLANFLDASAQGRGVLILTAHLGAWELSSFAHALHGYPMNFLVRHLDNPLLDRLVRHYRTLSGNRPITKKSSVRPVLQALKRGETVGILMDLNTQPHEGIFCDFFGLPACTSPIIATLAQHTGAPVVPGYLIWDEEHQKHRLHFEPPVEITTTGDIQQNTIINTTRFNQALEAVIRRYPDQWLWVHKRWHTRPEGAGNVYPDNPGPS